MQAPRRSAIEKAEATQNLVSLEERVEELVHRIKPNHLSDRRRREVGNYVKDLIKRCFLPAQQVEAYMFGSVPLKTYLPDGDIDLAVFQGKGPRLRDVWTYELSALLEAEGRNALNPHRVKDVQIINAEVKLLKCLVDNIVVDISFDTLGGLCTVAFLESIDRHIGKQHLFKRSVILVKAWCYYESRLLGAHHGLLSTYALETMVLYIFNMYHHELQSPLKASLDNFVLRKFLDAFSKFDWDAHALSLQGPIPLTSFPDPQVEPVAGAEGGALLRGDVLKAMLEMYSPVQQGAGKAFAIKNMNIVDPLLPTNNLGRSVNKASKARIRKALAHGSHMLDAIFDKVGQDAIEAADHFFRNTWNAQRAQVPSLGRLHSESLAHVPSFCRPLMVPAAMSPVPSQPRSADSQAFHPAYLMAFGPQGAAAMGMHDGNSNGAVELGRAGRTFSGPLPERPHSSASNMSASSELPGPSAGPAAGEAWARSQPGMAYAQSVLANGSGTELRRSESGRAGPSGLDPGGHHKRDNSTPHLGQFEGALRSNGLVSMPLPGQEQMLLPMYAYALHGMAYPVPLQPGSLHLRYPPAMPAFGPTRPNGRLYHQQQPLLPASSGFMYQRPAPQSSAGEGVAPADAQAKDLLEGDLLTLSQHLTVARRCHKFVTSQDSAPAVAEQRPQEDHPQPQQPPSHQPAHLRTSRSQLGLDQQRPPQVHGVRQSGHQRGTGATRKDNAVMNNRARAPPRSSSADNLELRHIRAHAAAEAAKATVGLGQLPRATMLTPPLFAHAPAPAAGATPVPVRVSAPTQAANVIDNASAAKGRGEAEAAQSSSRPRTGPAQVQKTHSSGHPRPADGFASAPTEAARAGAGAQAERHPLPVRTLADAVREGPSGQRGPDQQSQQQHQPPTAPVTPTKAQPGPYSSAVLGLSRSQRSLVHNGPVSAQPPSPATTSSGNSRGGAAGSPNGLLHPASSPTAGHHSAAAQGRLRVDTSADGGRANEAIQSAAAAAPAPPPKQPPAPPPAKFALNNEGDFPQLGAVKTRKAPSRGGPAGHSPAGSAVHTPVADSKPTSPSFSAASTPVTAPGAKRVWAGNSAGLLQSASNSPAGWPNRPDARAGLGAQRHTSDAGGTSRSEGSSPMAGNTAKGAVWPAQSSGQTAWRGTPPGAALSSALGSGPTVKR